MNYHYYLPALFVACLIPFIFSPTSCRYQPPAVETAGYIVGISAGGAHHDGDSSYVSATEAPDFDPGEPKRSMADNYGARVLQPCTFLRTIAGGAVWHGHRPGNRWRSVAARIRACLVRSPSIPVRLCKLII